MAKGRARGDVLGEDFEGYLEGLLPLSQEEKALADYFDTFFGLAAQAMALRDKKCWTQQQAAHAAGVHQSDISRLESGHGHNLSPGKLCLIARAYGLTLIFSSIQTGKRKKS